MKFEEYIELCEAIAKGENRLTPYDADDYWTYAKLNSSRMQRWLKKGKLSDAVTDVIKRIQSPQEWIVITEPWCGDAAHSVPFIGMLAAVNANVNLRIELRDTEPYRIEQYLTNGSKSIPKWIVRDEKGDDLFVWGPRPEETQRLFVDMKNQGVDMDAIKEAIQKWYNEDEGRAFLEEVAAAFNSFVR